MSRTRASLCQSAPISTPARVFVCCQWEVSKVSRDHPVNVQGQPAAQIVQLQKVQWREVGSRFPGRLSLSAYLHYPEGLSPRNKKRGRDEGVLFEGQCRMAAMRPEEEEAQDPSVIPLHR